MTCSVCGPGKNLMRGRFRKDVVLFWRDPSPEEKAKDIRLNSMIIVGFAPSPLGLADKVEEIDARMGVKSP